MVTFGLCMQPVAQTTTRDFLAVSAGALEIAIVIQGALEVLSLNLCLPFGCKSHSNTEQVVAYLVSGQLDTCCHVHGSRDDVLSRVCLYTYCYQTNGTLL